ncbi:MAG: RDD family protein [Chitinophagaceae bacterium]|jgi:uncharacterized RDD family membrane protein YckC|nr:RDD family protein [Chitinophagaceae bacterium]
MANQNIPIIPAGIGTRVLNFLTDTFIILLLSYYAVYKPWSFYVYYWHYTFIPFYLFFWGTLVAYYFLFESIFKRTPGKWLTGTCVVNNAGSKPSVFWILIRSIVRVIIIDCFFIPFLNDKTLHDYLSKTNVVARG